MSDADNAITEPGASDASTAAAPGEVAFLRQRFGAKLLSHQVFRGDLSVTVDASVITDALRALRDEHDPSYNYLSYVTADHWIEQEERGLPARTHPPERGLPARTSPPEREFPARTDPPMFEVHYGLQALPKPGARLRLVVVLPDTPGVTAPSATAVHPGANPHEREVYDLFGIEFTGHPNLERILTPETYPDHPLRRDFPHSGPELTEFQDRLIAKWNVAERRDYTGKFGDPWVRKMWDAQTGHISLERLAEEASPEHKLQRMGDVAYREDGEEAEAQEGGEE